MPELFLIFLRDHVPGSLQDQLLGAVRYRRSCSCGSGPCRGRGCGRQRGQNFPRSLGRSGGTVDDVKVEVCRGGTARETVFERAVDQLGVPGDRHILKQAGGGLVLRLLFHNGRPIVFVVIIKTLNNNTNDQDGDHGNVRHD